MDAPTVILLYGPQDDVHQAVSEGVPFDLTHLTRHPSPYVGYGFNTFHNNVRRTEVYEALPNKGGYVSAEISIIHKYPETVARWASFLAEDYPSVTVCVTKDHAKFKILN